jgi:hypothetical protein
MEEGGVMKMATAGGFFGGIYRIQGISTAPASIQGVTTFIGVTPP